MFVILKHYRITVNYLNGANAFQEVDGYFISSLTFGMSQFRMNCRTFVAAMPFVAWNTSLATTDDGLDIDAGILDLFQRESLQYLMFLRIADVQVSVSRRDAQIILICYLSCAGKKNRYTI